MATEKQTLDVSDFSLHVSAEEIARLLQATIDEASINTTCTKSDTFNGVLVTITTNWLGNGETNSKIKMEKVT